MALLAYLLVADAEGRDTIAGEAWLEGVARGLGVCGSWFLGRKGQVLLYLKV